MAVEDHQQSCSRSQELFLPWVLVHQGSMELAPEKQEACPGVLSMEESFKPIGGFTAKASARIANYLGTVAKLLLKYYFSFS